MSQCQDCAKKDERIDNLEKEVRAGSLGFLMSDFWIGFWVGVVVTACAKGLAGI